MNEADPRQAHRTLRAALRMLISLVLGAGVLAAGAWAAMWLVETGPRADRRRPPRRARRVEVQPVRRQSSATLVHANGTVKPARAIALHPRVAGQVAEVSPHLEPGGLIPAGEMIVQIDRADFDLRVRQRESEVGQIRADVRIEQGRQSVARREYELLGETIVPQDRDLVLRRPQLQTVQARLEAVEAALEQARLDRERTTVTAPFNAMVQSRQVNLGSYITTSTTVATLVGTDTYWVEVAVPVGQLKWIDVPDGADGAGSSARVHNRAAWGPDVCREGRAVRLAGDLEDQGRMARLLVAVDDPLGLADAKGRTPRLLLNAYVSVVIEGRALDDVVVLDRRHLHAGDHVWVLSDGKLAIRPVDVVYRGRKQVFIDGGLSEGEQLITTNLSAAVEGMALRTGDASPRAPGRPGATDTLGEAGPPRRGRGAGDG